MLELEPGKTCYQAASGHRTLESGFIGYEPGQEEPYRNRIPRRHQR